jgi:hypothetical protein
MDQIQMPYPETDIVDLHSIPQQLISQSELSKGLDRLGLHAICSARGRLVWPVVQDGGLDAMSD